MKRAIYLVPLLLLGCSAPEPGEAPAVTTVSAPEPFPELATEIQKIEEDTSTEVGIALYDGRSMHTAGSLKTLPAWSSIKVPIARAAAGECGYDEATKEELATAAIEWSDNDAARSLWDCMGSDEVAGEKVAEEIANAGTTIEVEGAFGRTDWPFTDQARYGYYLSKQDENDLVIGLMHHIAEDQSYGLGQLSGVPFKGGWSDDYLDGSWHTRQFGWLKLGDKVYGVAVGARSEAGSYQDTIDALDAASKLLR